MSNNATQAAMSEAREAGKARALQAKAAPASLTAALKAAGYTPGQALTAGDADYIARPEDTRPAVSTGYISASPATSPAAKPKGYAKGAEAPPHYILTGVIPNNPKKPGSAAYAVFSLYPSLIGKTLAEVAKAGTRGDILWDLKRGYITIAPPNA